MRSWRYEIGLVFRFFEFLEEEWTKDDRGAYDVLQKTYHVAKANMQPPPGEEQGRSLGVKLPAFWYPVFI